MRTLALFALSLASAGMLSGGALAQENSKAVTYRTPAVTLSKALEDLSAKTGMNLRPAANIADELILIRVKDAKASDVMKKVAEAIGAEWVMEGDIYRLARPSSMNEAERRAELADKVKKLQAAVDKHTADVRQTPNWTIEDAKKAQQSNKKRGDGEFAIAIAQDDGGGGPPRTFSFGGPGDVSPASRAMARLVPLLNINDLAALEPGERIVYSTQPTRMQKALPNKTFEVFQTLTKEQALWDQLQESSRANRPAPPRPGGTQEPQTGPPAKALVIASKMGMGDAINLTMLVADANGNVITTQMSFLGDVFFRMGDEAEPAKGQGGPVKISPEALELAKMLSTGGGMMGRAVSIAIDSGAEGDNVAFLSSGEGPTKRTKLTPEWRSKIISPNSWEPLASIPSELVLGYADATDSNLVASLPDDSLVKAARLAQMENLTSAAVENGLRSAWGLSVKSADGFVVVRPNRPFTARRQKADRAKLERLLKYLDRNNRISLDELAAYAYAHPVAPAFDSLDTALIRLLDPATADQEFMRGMTGQRDMLRLWGALSSAQRQSLLNGIPLPIGNMNTEQQGIVARLTFQSQDGPQLTQGGGPGRGRQFAGGGPFGFMSNLRNERTEFLPFGLPNDLALNLRTQVREAVIATNSESGNGMVFSPQTLAMTRNMRVNMQGAGGETLETATYDTYQMADQNTLNFTLQYGRLAQLQRQLTDTIAQRGSKAGNYDALPEAFRKQVDEASARIQNRSQRVREGGGGGDVPPPR